MPTTHMVGLPFTMVESSSNVVGTFFPDTPWMSAANVGRVRPTYEVVYRTGNLTIAFAYQTCDVETSQDTPITVGSYNAAGVAFPTTGYTDISTNTSPKQLVRFGWLVMLSAGTTQSFGYVGGSVDVMECA